MYDLNSKQYIIKQKSGRTLTIFNKPNSGAYLSSLSKKGIWTDPSLITKDILPDFNICSDESDKIHILCQDRQGHIKYMIYENEKWNSKIILKSRSFSPYDKHLCVVSNEKNVHFFYTLRYSEKNLLSYQQLKNSGELSDPKVIDYVSESSHPYIVHQDSNGNLYLFYTYQDNKYSRMGYKKYTVTKNTWSDFSPLTDFNSESNIVAVASLSNAALYACWQRHLTSGYELVLSVKDKYTEEWNKEVLISKSSIPFSDSSMLILENKLLVYWFREHSIMYSSSYDKGRTWTSPEAYVFPGNDQIKCISFICNTSDDCFKQHCSIVPGTVNANYKLAFSDKKLVETDIPTLNKSVTDDVLPNVLSLLNNLYQDMEGVKKILTEIEEILEVMENNQKQIDVELGRYNSKLVITDSDLSKIKSLLTDFKPSDDNKQTKEEKSPIPLTESCSENSTNYDITNQTPVMPGTGFASITPEFLRSLQKK